MKFKIHREGFTPLLIVALLLIALSSAVIILLPAALWFFITLAVLSFIWMVRFFRNPPRPIAEKDPQWVYAPADGKIVVIEEVREPEYFHDKRIQISIFMSPNNVHVNRNPVSGTVDYYQYHAGKYQVAWHPKSSSENERNTIVYNTGNYQILLRQIAGAMARRIRCYLEVGQQVEQGEDMGFIKFGSRVDLFLPLEAEVLVNPGQKVKGNVDKIARLPAVL